MELTLRKGSREVVKTLGRENSEGRSAKDRHECQGVSRQTKLLDKEGPRKRGRGCGGERGGRKAGWLASGLKQGSLGETVEVDFLAGRTLQSTERVCILLSAMRNH